MAFLKEITKPFRKPNFGRIGSSLPDFDDKNIRSAIEKFAKFREDVKGLDVAGLAEQEAISKGFEQAGERGQKSLAAQSATALSQGTLFGQGEGARERALQQSQDRGSELTQRLAGEEALGKSQAAAGNIGSQVGFQRQAIAGIPQLEIAAEKAKFGGALQKAQQLLDVQRTNLGVGLKERQARNARISGLFSAFSPKGTEAQGAAVGGLFAS